MPELNLTKLLRKSLDGARKIAVLGVGSDLRADDVAGMLVAEKLHKRCTKNGSNPLLEVFLGATAPENLTGEIKRFSPSHLIIVDAADTGAEPGTINVIPPENVAGISFSTHQMPLKLMVDYLNQSFECKIMIIGIQPGVLKFGQSPSKEVLKSVAQVTAALESVVSSLTV